MQNKFISFLTAVFFAVCTFLCPAPKLFAAEPETAKSESVFSLSRDLGSYVYTPAAQKDRPYVFFIQDAHGNDEAQNRIRDILTEIIPQLGTKTVLVEGASLGLDPSILQFTSSQELNKKIAGKLAERGFVTGAELFSLEPGAGGISFLGLEEAPLYEREREAFMTVVRRKAESEKALAILTSRLNGLKARVFDAKLKDIDRNFQGYEAGRLTLLSWFDSLRRVVTDVLGFSLNDPRRVEEYPNLVRLAVSHEASRRLMPERFEAEKKEFLTHLAQQPDLARFVEDLGTEKQTQGPETEELAWQLYDFSTKEGLDWLQFPEIRKAIISLLLSREMAGEELFREMETLKEALYESLAQGEKEKIAVSLDHNLRLLKDLLSLEATREVWSKSKDHLEDLSPRKWMERFKELDPSARGLDPEGIDELEDVFEKAREFYSLAEERERVFMTRIEQALAWEPSGALIVIGGGFHTDGLAWDAKEKDLNFVIIQPRLEKKTDLVNYYQAVFQTTSLPFLASKMAADPFSSIPDPEQPGQAGVDAKIQILLEILNGLARGDLAVMEPPAQVAENVRTRFALAASLGAPQREKPELVGSRTLLSVPAAMQALQVPAISTQHTAVTLDRLAAVNVTPTEMGENAGIQLSSAVNPQNIGTAFVLGPNAQAYLSGAKTEIRENLTVAPNSRFAVVTAPENESRAYLRAGNKLTIQGDVTISLGVNARVIIGDNVTLRGLNLVVGDNQFVVIQNQAVLIGQVLIAPFAAIAGAPVPEYPALWVGPAANVEFEGLDVPSGAQLVVPQNTVAQGETRIPTLRVPDNRPEILRPAEERPGTFAPVIEPQFSIPQAAGKSLGVDQLTPSILAEELTRAPGRRVGPVLPPAQRPVLRPPTLARPSAPRFRMPETLPQAPPVFGLTEVDLAGGVTGEAYLKYILAARAAVAPPGLAPEQEALLNAEISGESVLLRPLVQEGVLTPLRPWTPKRRISWDELIARVSEGANQEFLSLLIHNLLTHRVAVTVGVSDSQGVFSLNNPAFRDSVAFHLENNPNSVFRFVHLGTEEEAQSIRQSFSRFGERFQVVASGPTPADWDPKLRGLLGEDLLVVVKRLPAGLEIRDLESLYRERHISVMLSKSQWQVNPKLPHAAMVKVTSLASDSKLGSEASRNPKLVADVSFLEVSLAQLASVLKGIYKDLSQVIPHELFVYSEGRYSLNTDNLVAGLLSDIHDQALALLELARKA